MTQHCDILLEGGVVVTMDDSRRVIERGVVAVRGNRIAAVGTQAELSGWRAQRIVDCSGQAVIPGLIDSHNHLFQVAGRGLGDGMALWQWLSEFMLPLAAGIQPQEAVAAVRVGALEAMSSGTTTIIDNHYAPNDTAATLQVAGALHDMGLRGAVARGVFGPFTDIARDNHLSPLLFQNSTRHEIDSMRECLAEWHSDRVQIWSSPINVIYNDQDLVRGLVQLADEFDVRWQTHCSEAAIDPEIYQQAYGLRPFIWMEKEGLLGHRASFAHAIWLDDAEIECSGARQCGIAHNPMSNQYLASGAMRLRDARAAGATVGMGADGAAGHLMDMFQIMRQMVYVQRLHTLDPEASFAEEAFELATRGGAQLAGLDAGRLEQGRLADIAVVSMRGAHMAPCFNPVANLVYCASGRDVTLTIVDGHVVYENGRATLVDQDEIVRDAHVQCKRLIERLDIPTRRKASAPVR